MPGENKNLGLNVFEMLATMLVHACYLNPDLVVLLSSFLFVSTQPIVLQLALDLMVAKGWSSIITECDLLCVSSKPDSIERSCLNRASQTFVFPIRV